MALSSSKNIPRLFRGITSNTHGDFYCVGCLHSFTTKNKLKDHERLCNNHKYGEIIMPTEDRKILKHNHGEKSLKVPHLFYIDTESLLLKHQSSQNHPEKSYTETKAIYEACGYALNLVTSYDSNKNTHTYYRGKDCIQKLCKELKTQAIEIIKYEKKKMIPLTNNEKEYYEKRKYCHICHKKFCYNENDEKEYKLYHKVKDHCHYTGKFRDKALNICNLRYKIQREIPVVLHNGSNYDNHFINTKLSEKFKGNLDCLGENMEKYITFSAPLKKVNTNGKLITYKLKFIDSCRFMQASISNLTDNLSEIN